MSHPWGGFSITCGAKITVEVVGDYRVDAPQKPVCSIQPCNHRTYRIRWNAEINSRTGIRRCEITVGHGAEQRICINRVLIVSTVASPASQGVCQPVADRDNSGTVYTPEQVVVADYRSGISCPGLQYGIGTAGNQDVIGDNHR